MLATLKQKTAPLASPDEAGKATHILVVLPTQDKPEKSWEQADFFGKDLLNALLSRRKMKPEDISQTPVSANLQSGALCVWVRADSAKSVFEQQASVRKAVQLLLEESPSEINISIYGDPSERRTLAQLAVYVTWINGSLLPSRKTSKKDGDKQPLGRIVLHGHKEADNFALLQAKAEGNLLTRELTVLPPNELTPGFYRKYVKKLADSEGWKYQDFDVKALRKMGAGAFVAVAQGSDPEDAAIVYLRRRVKSASKTVA